MIHTVLALLVPSCALAGFLAGPLIERVAARVPHRQPVFGGSDACARCGTGAREDPAGEGAVGEGPVGEGAVGEGPVGEGPVGEGAVGEGPAGEGPGGGVRSLSFRRRRCAGCAAPVGGRAAVVGLACGALFAVAAWRFSDSWVLPAYLLLFATLLAISLIDVEHHIVPNRILGPSVIASIGLLGLGSLADGAVWPFVRAMLAGTAAFSVLLMLNLAAPAGLGMGDVKLAFLLGLFLGWIGWSLVAIGLFLGFVLGGFGGLALIAIGVRDRKDEIAFAPFLSAGTVLGILIGERLFSWYPGF